MLTKTYDKNSREIIVSTSSPFEQKSLTSKSDWRLRAIAASKLHMKGNHIYIHAEEITTNDFTYILPKNLIQKFICISDLRIKIAGFLYGSSSPHSSCIQEIRCFALPPQLGNSQTVNIPKMLPPKHLVENLQLLGWIILLQQRLMTSIQQN